MLILARESRGMSQADLARAVELTQGKISKYENGMFAVSDCDLKKIATVLDYTPEFFFQRDNVYGLGSSFLFHRQRKAVPISVQRKIQAEINILRMQVTRLLNGLEVSPENRFETLDSDQFDGHVEKIVALVKAGWKVPLGPVNNVTAIVEGAGGIVLRCAFGTKLIDAAHLWLPGLPPLFFLNRELSGDRLRWTLAHEIGHAIMHRSPTGDVEAEANAFASEFLLPRREVENHLADMTLERAASLKTVWKVSMAAIIKRAFDLRAITQAKYRRLFTSLSANGYRTNEPFPVPVEEPQTVRRLVDLHRTALNYTNFDLAKLLFAVDEQYFAPGTMPRLMRFNDEPFFAFSISPSDPQEPLRLKFM